jgi:hypothetical protein
MVVKSESLYPCVQVLEFSLVERAYSHSHRSCHQSSGGTPLVCRPLTDITAAVAAVRRNVEWGHEHTSLAVGVPPPSTGTVPLASNGKSADTQHHYSKMYLSDQGMFAAAPQDLRLGTRLQVSTSCQGLGLSVYEDTHRDLDK